MSASYVLRLAPVPLAIGELAGEVESVATGEHVVFNGAEELLAFCVRHTIPLPSPRQERQDHA